MRKTYKYRLYPNQNQARELEICLETHRRLYCEAMDCRNLAWECYKSSISYIDQSRWFCRVNKVNPWYAKINVTSAQRTLKRLDEAYQNFYRRCKKGGKPGFPRFPSKDRWNSVCFTYGNGAKIVKGKLRLQHVGTIKVKWSREIPVNAKIKTAQVNREGNKWFVCFSLEIPNIAPAKNTKPSVGIDVGLTSFVTTSEGETLGSSRVLEDRLKDLRRNQRALSRCSKTSNRRKKVKRKVSRLHEKVRNTRLDMQHKVSRSLVDRYGVIAAESLNVQGMVKNRRLARRISDAGWSQFLNILAYKAEEAGGKVVLVNPKNTSQMCSGCGEIVKKSLSVRTHRCSCGLVINRDYNAAINILVRAEPEFHNVGIA